MTAVRCLHIFTDETLNARDIQLQLERVKAKNEILERDNGKLEERCDELFEEIVRMKESQREVEEEQEKLFKDIETLEDENFYLRKYVDKIQELEEMTNTSKRLDQLKDRQQRRKIKELKTNVERALWFAKAFGLRLASVTFKATNDKDASIEL
ncbi:predicted protein [Nematostella vectensis]|uniref:Cilia- and flagella-associated protein 157 n=1 Tax=Nematostella vectensis TaxID=45351 RepID=A7SSV4_NEMVE|nr:predicted protein [Nematostella vectensis]|eukprot:XP_001625319.1 predicted protein [Nematostella vectensis]